MINYVIGDVTPENDQTLALWLVNNNEGGVDLMCRTHDERVFPILAITEEGKLRRYRNIPRGVGLQVGRSGKVKLARED